MNPLTVLLVELSVLALGCAACLGGMAVGEHVHRRRERRRHATPAE